ncbi:hypothetical protein SAMN05421636_105272 [Pricia antarctica]|uniref:Uncharacterized protein n=1 Tax=Pricia antarctica TaxID=641691 RepID=A0A1G7DEK7_9FLAO|nr:hypothetical protein SAMN05421636_105272 [Pricia antarctica]
MKRQSLKLVQNVLLLIKTIYFVWKERAETGKVNVRILYFEYPNPYPFFKFGHGNQI